VSQPRVRPFSLSAAAQPAKPATPTPEAKASSTRTRRSILVKNALSVLQKSGYQIVFGTLEQLDTWEQANNGNRFQPRTLDYLGKTDPVSKIILIPNMAGETMAHELVHAATRLSSSMPIRTATLIRGELLFQMRRPLKTCRTGREGDARSRGQRCWLPLSRSYRVDDQGH